MSVFAPYWAPKVASPFFRKSEFSSPMNNLAEIGQVVLEKKSFKEKVNAHLSIQSGEMRILKGL